MLKIFSPLLEGQTTKVHTSALRAKGIRMKKKGEKNGGSGMSQAIDSERKSEVWRQRGQPLNTTFFRRLSVPHDSSDVIQCHIITAEQPSMHHLQYSRYRVKHTAFCSRSEVTHKDLLVNAVSQWKPVEYFCKQLSHLACISLDTSGYYYVRWWQIYCIMYMLVLSDITMAHTTLIKRIL